MGLMNGDMDDEDPFDDRNKASLNSTSSAKQQPIPLAAPKPGYAAPVAALKLPSPTASPDGRLHSPTQMSQVGGVKPLTLVTNMNGPGSPRIPPPAAINVPSTPHPLQPPMTPIMPIFARPSPSPAPRDVKFAAGSAILRGDKEDTLLPRRQSRFGEQGDNFWRRFSMVVKVESTQKESIWLKKTRSGDTRASRWVWIIGIILLLCVAGGIGIGWYIAHNNTTHSAPTAIGGSANEKAIEESTAPAAGVATAASPHVSPTHTVARRDLPLIPTGAVHIPLSQSNARNSHDSILIPVAHKRHKRHALNRTIH
ncbi:unnamed protein product [Somion occarium]